MALAAPALTARSLQLAGETHIGAQDGALFVVAGPAGFVWDVQAASGTLTRHFSTYTAVDHPANGHFAYSHRSEWQDTEQPLKAVTLVSSGVTPGGALLVVADAANVNAQSAGELDVTSVRDPTLSQVEPAPSDLATEERVTAEIRRTLDGHFIEMLASEGEFVIRGDIVMELYGPSYTLNAASSDSIERTGDYETARNAIVSEGREESHLIELFDAVLTVRTTEGAALYSSYVQLEMDGALSAATMEGELVLGGALVSPVDGMLEWSGAAELSLAPSDGRFLISTPEPVLGTSGAIVGQGPPVAALTFALALLSVAAAAAIVLYRRREKGSDLDLALLAMEERRWDAALPPLTRLAKKQPMNAVVLVDRALCLEQSGRVEEAAKAFETALRVAPAHAEAHFYYARTLAKMRESEAARVHLETALEHDPRLVELARGERVLRGL